MKRIAEWDDLEDRVPARARVGNVDLVLIRAGDDISVLYGRCLHRGALLADGQVHDEDLICGLHGWDYRFMTGVSAYTNSERLERFAARVEDGGVWIDEEEIGAWEREHPQPYDRSAYQGAYQDPHGTQDEPFVSLTRGLAANGLEGSHGPIGAMGVPRSKLPSWDDLLFVTAQLAKLPQLDGTPVETELVVGPDAERPLVLDIPIIVSDMSFGALSQEAKIALAVGAENAGTGIASGEGGMLPEEQAANSRYFYELAPGRFGFSWDKLAKVQAFHFKAGQAAKTGSGGYLPGSKVTGRVGEVRGLLEGTPAVSPARFPEWEDLDGYRSFANQVRSATRGSPIGIKLSAQHIEEDLDAALQIGIDYVILDGRGGGTAAAPLILRDHISVPTMPALARARRHLDAVGSTVTLLITGGLRTPADFAKALALGADGIAISNAALQAIGCLGMRACHTNNCPVGIATQRPHLRQRLPVGAAAERLTRFLGAAVDLMKVLARACGHTRLADFDARDLTTWKREVADLTGVRYAGVRS